MAEAPKFISYYWDYGPDNLEMLYHADSLKEAESDCASKHNGTPVYIYKLVKKGETSTSVDWESVK